MWQFIAKYGGNWNVNNILIQWNMTWKTFMQRFWGIKMGIFAVLLFFLEDIFLHGLRQFCIAVQYPVTPWVLTFLMSNIYFQILVMAFVIYYYSNVPFMQQWGIYQMIRAGRTQWALAQIGSIVLSAVGITVLVFLEEILLLIRHMEFRADWGKVLHTIALTNAGKEYSMHVSSNPMTMNKYTALGATGLTVLLSILVISFIGLVMFAISLFLPRIVSVSVAGVLLVLPVFGKNLGVYAQKIFNCFSPVSWMRVEEIGGERLGYQIMPELSYIMPVLLSLLLILCVIILWRVQKVEFQWNKED